VASSTLPPRRWPRRRPVPAFHLLPAASPKVLPFLGVFGSTTSSPCRWHPATSAARGMPTVAPPRPAPPLPPPTCFPFAGCRLAALGRRRWSPWVIIVGRSTIVFLIVLAPWLHVVFPSDRLSSKPRGPLRGVGFGA
jgi:hypothetical protein